MISMPDSQRGEELNNLITGWDTTPALRNWMTAAAPGGQADRRRAGHTFHLHACSFGRDEQANDNGPAVKMSL